MKLQELMYVIEPKESVLIADEIGRELSDIGTAKALQKSRRYERLRECDVLGISAESAPGWGEYIEVVIDLAEE